MSHFCGYELIYIYIWLDKVSENIIPVLTCLNALTLSHNLKYAVIREIYAFVLLEIVSIVVNQWILAQNSDIRKAFDVGV